MAALFTWTEKEFGLKVKDMDDEHIVLFDYMNKLYASFENKESFNNLQLHMDNLIKYTVKHFTDEEAFLQKINFPGLDTHKIIHAQLIEQFNGHIKTFKETKALNKEFFNFLSFWLTAHIKGIDTKYAKFYTEKKTA